MDGGDKQFITNQITDIKNEIRNIQKQNEIKWKERNKLYDERKTTNDREFQRVHESITKLFEKSDNVESAVNNISVSVINATNGFNETVRHLNDNVLKKEDLPCRVHQEQLKNVKKDVGRLYKWIAGIFVALTSALGLKEYFMFRIK